MSANDNHINQHNDPFKESTRVTKPNIFLVGMMAVGKSTVGRLLGQNLGMDFYDTDSLVEERAGVDIGWIFDVEGEESFRKREQIIVEEFSRNSNIVLATGGGVVENKNNIGILKKRGIVVYLSATLDLLVKRTANDKTRPVLQKAKSRPLAIKQILQRREPLYDFLADIKFSTDKRTPKAVTHTIVRHLNELGLFQHY